MAKYINSIQAYLIAISVFFSILIFVPGFNNVYTLPKLLVLYFFGFITIFLEGTKIISTRRFNIQKSDFFIILFLGLNFLSWFFALSHSLSFWGEYSKEGLGLFSLYCYASYAFVYTRLDLYHRNIIKTFFVGGTVIAALYSITQFIEIRERPNGLEGQPIQSAHTIALGMLVGINLLYSFTLSSKIKNVLYVLLGVIFLLALYVLESSTVILSLVATATLTVLFNFKNIRKSFNSVTIYIIGIILLSTILILFSLLPKKTFSTSQRVNELRKSVEMIQKESFTSTKTFLIGNGQNSSMAGYREYKSSSDYQTPEWQWQLSNIRNHYLEAFYTTGILGFIIWHSLLLAAIILSLKKKNITATLIFFFIIAWQFFYYVFPLTVLIALLYETEQLDEPLEIKVGPLVASLISIPILILGAYGIIQTVNLTKAEHAYSTQNYKEAMRLAPGNYYYPAEYAHTLYNSINTFRYYGNSCAQKRSCSHRYINEFYEEGIMHLKKSLTLNPYESDYWNALASYYFLQYYDNGSTQKILLKASEEAAQAGLKIELNNPLLLDSMGAVHLERGELESAEAYFRRALRSKPDLTVSQNHLQETLKQKNAL